MTVKTALVTGAASGIGLAIARALSQAEHRVVLVDRDLDKLDFAHSEIADSVAVQLDITDWKSVDALPSALPEETRDIDILVNAAGHDPGGTTRYDLGKPADWQSAIETNLLGTMRVTRAFLPAMVARNIGDIVNIGSVAGIRIVPDMAAYGASKAGVHTFTDQLRADLAKTAIRVIEIMPGLTKTDLIRKRYQGDVERAAEYYARFEMALDPADVAQCVLHAISAPSSVVVAQTLVLPNNRW